jgi:hypothetical protein
MIEKQTITYLRLAHGSFNVTMMLLFFYQGFLGFRIRQGRKSGNQAVRAIKRHRKAGPVLALMGVAGFVAGMTIVYLDYRHLLFSQDHF